MAMDQLMAETVDASCLKIMQFFRIKGVCTLEIFKDANIENKLHNSKAL